MKIMDAIRGLADATEFHPDDRREAVIEFLGAAFPCGYPEAVVHDAVKGVRPVLIECVAGMVSTDEARGLVADLIRAIDEAESR